MQEVGAAILFAKAVVCGAGVEECDPLSLGHAGNRQQLRRGEVGHDETNSYCCELAEARSEIALLGYDRLCQRKGLASETAGSIVVGDAEPRTLDALVLGRLVEIGER